MLQNTRRRCSRTHNTAINSARAPVDAGVRGISLCCDRHRAIRCGGRVSALPAGPTQQGQVNPRASSLQRLLAAATGFEAQHRLHATEGTAHTGKLLLRSALPCVLASSACAGCNRARGLLCSPELQLRWCRTQPAGSASNSCASAMQAKSHRHAPAPIAAQAILILATLSPDRHVGLTFKWGVPSAMRPIALHRCVPECGVLSPKHTGLRMSNSAQSSPRLLNPTLHLVLVAPQVPAYSLGGVEARLKVRVPAQQQRHRCLTLLKSNTSSLSGQPPYKPSASAHPVLHDSWRALTSLQRAAVRRLRTAHPP